MIKDYLKHLIAPAFLILIFTGCSSNLPDPAIDSSSSPLNESIYVAAATDLQPWLGDALSQWAKAQNPPLNVQTTYGASGKIAAQVRAGAPIDLFLSADVKLVEQLAEEGFTTIDNIHHYASGRLALIHSGSKKFEVWKDVGKSDFKHLVIANPATAPYGRAAKSALEMSGLWPQVEGRMVFAESVRQALQLVVEGNAEAGIVALGHAKEAVSSNPNLTYIELPETDHPAIIQGLALINHPDQTEKRREQTRLIINWILSPDTDMLFENHGLKRDSREPN